MKPLDKAGTVRLLNRAFVAYSEPKPGGIQLGHIARVVGVEEEFLEFWYNDLSTLLRMAVDEKIRGMTASLSYRAPDSKVRDVVSAYSQLCAQLFASDDYRRLCFMVVRDAATFRWLGRKHEALIEQMQLGLSRLVGDACDEAGCRLDIRASGARALIGRLQRELALPMLLPKQKKPTHLDIRDAAQRAAGEALAAVYPVATAAGLMRLVGTPPRRAGASANHRPAWEAPKPRSVDRRREFPRDAGRAS